MIAPVHRCSFLEQCQATLSAWSVAASALQRRGDVGLLPDPPWRKLADHLVAVTWEDIGVAEWKKWPFLGCCVFWGEN